MCIADKYAIICLESVDNKKEKEINEIVGVNSFNYPKDLSKFDCIVITTNHKEFKTNSRKLVKYLKNCNFILDNMKVWEKINFPQNIEYKISGEKNWL